MDDLQLYRDTLIYLVLLTVVFVATVLPALLAMQRMRARTRYMHTAGGRQGFQPWPGSDEILVKDLQGLGVVEPSTAAAVFHPLYREEVRRRAWLFDLLTGQSGWRRYMLRDRAAGATRTVVLVHSDAMDCPYLMIEPENPRSRALAALADRIENLHGLEPLEFPLGVRPVPGIRIRTRAGHQAEALRVVMDSGLLETLRREHDLAVRAEGRSMAVVRPLSPADPRQIGALLASAETLISGLENAAPARGAIGA